MSADLIFPLQKFVPFDKVLAETRRVLLRLLKHESIPALISDLPPRLQGTGIKLEERLIDLSFPGAYLKFMGDDESVVDFHVFESGDRLLVGCGGVSTPASNVLTAALTAATVQLMDDALIGDYGHHWIEKEEYNAAELIQKLELQEPQSDFSRAVDLVHRKLAIHDRYPLKSSP